MGPSRVSVQMAPQHQIKRATRRSMGGASRCHRHSIGQTGHCVYQDGLARAIFEPWIPRDTLCQYPTS